MFMGLLSSVAGGLMGTAGDWIGQQMGLKPDASNSTGSQGMTQAVNDVVGQAPGLTGASMYNAAGQVGGDAVRGGFANALSSLQNSASAISDANAMRDMANRGLNNVGTQSALARGMAQNQFGSLRRDTMNSLNASGASPAAMAAVMSKLGQGNQSGAAGLLSQAAQASAQAYGQAGQLRGQASNLLGQDLASRNAIYVDPYKAQINQGITSLAGQLGQQGAQNAMSAEQAWTNPLSGGAAGLGMAGAGLIGNWLSTSGNQTNEGTPGDPYARLGGSILGSVTG